MGKAWVKRWSPKVKDGMGSLVPALKITQNPSIEKLTWNLSPSKSHAIRWLALAAQSEQEVVLRGLGNAGQDIVSMRRCLGQMGVVITDLDADGNMLEVSTNDDDQPAKGSVAWKVHGVGAHGLKPPISVLHAGNSGTALRILMALCARFDVPVMLDGDASLRSRNHDIMIQALKDLGVSVSFGTGVEGLPLLVEGPWVPQDGLTIDISTSSQPVTVGEGRRSRLVNRLREELQIVESVSMDLSVLEQGSLITLEVICPDEHLEAVEDEVNRQLRAMAEELVSDQELKRGQQLVSNGLRYALESTGQVSGLSASQTLWDRQQDLLHPLAFLPPWTAERLRSDLFPRLQPEQAFVLTAQAKTKHG